MTLIDQIADVRHAEEDIFDAIKASGAPVVLWGAGELSWYVASYLREHGVEPACLCDNNPAKQGTLHLGLPVYNYEALKKKFAGRGGGYQVVASVGPQYKDAIFSQLAAAGDKSPAWYLRGYEVCGEKLNYQYLRRNLRQFEEAYSSLADEASKKVFVNVLNAKLSGDFSLYAAVRGGLEYFDEEIVELKGDEVYVDVGAYRGEDLLEFVRRTGGKHGGIIALEPDKKNLAILRETLSRHGIEGVEIHAIGAWHSRASLHFQDGREGSSRISETSDAAAPSTPVEVDSVDNVLNGRRATYISMDIEGAEHNVLLGAERTIKKWKPKMAVCAYHRREDLFDLLLLLRSFVPGYRFYLRHYSDNQTQTVLYAI